MKKRNLLAVISIITVLSLVLAGCGGSKGTAPSKDSKYIGTWEPTGAEFKGESIAIEEVFEDEKDVFTIELRGDGTAIVTDAEGDTTSTWTETKEGFNVKGADIDLKLKEKDGKAILEIFGFQLIFEKQ